MVIAYAGMANRERGLRGGVGLRRVPETVATLGHKGTLDFITANRTTQASKKGYCKQFNNITTILPIQKTIKRHPGGKRSVGTA
jgi:hypothetical protein